MLLGAALAVRLAALWLTSATPAAGDEPELFMRAVRLVEGHGFGPDGGRAPGPLVFYAAAFRLLGTAPWAAKLANVVASTATVLPVYWIGRRYGGVRVGWAAGAIVAFYPTFVAFSHYLWPAPLYGLVAASGVALLLRADEQPALWRAALCGAVLGLSALCKEAGILLPFVATGWLLWRGRAEPRGAALRAAVLVGAVVVVMLPWMLHLNRPGEPFALVTRTGYMNLFIGNHPISHGHGIEEYARLSPDRRERERIARERAAANIRARLPWWPLEKVMEQVPRFFTPTSFAVRRLLSAPDDPGGWGYRFRFASLDRRGLRVAAVVAVVAAYLAVALAGSAGLVLARRRDLSLLFVLLIASQLVPSIATFAMSRFRLTSMLFLALGAAACLVEGRVAWREASTSRHLAAATAALAMGVIVSLDYSAVLSPTGR